MSGDIFIASGLSEGEKIRLARLSKWLRQVDVASLAGVSLVEVTNAEKDRYVTPERKARILKVVGLLDNDGENEATS
jgi:transcriptional regulator with XRE-family HTH domain